MKSWMIKSVNVLSIVYKIRYYKNKKSLGEKEDTCGETDFEDKTIKIWTGQSDNETAKTIIHEILEAINYEYYIRLNHNQIEKLEGAIFDTWSRNGLKELMG